MKRCVRCNIVKDYTEFYSDKSRKDGKTNRCIECDRIKKKVYYIINRSNELQRSKRFKLKLYEWYYELKSECMCCLCGESDPICLDFHHINPKTKIATISSMIKSRTPRLKILEEIKKCIVLCANCHRKTHKDELSASVPE